MKRNSIYTSLALKLASSFFFCWFFVKSTFEYKTGFSFSEIVYILIFQYRYMLSTGNKYCCFNISLMQLSHTDLKIYFYKPQTVMVPWLQVTGLTALSDITKYIYMVEPEEYFNIIPQCWYLLLWCDCQFPVFCLIFI